MYLIINEILNVLFSLNYEPLCKDIGKYYEISFRCKNFPERHKNMIKALSINNLKNINLEKDIVYIFISKIKIHNL